MTLEELRAYCARKKGVTYDMPFGPDVLVFRVVGKIFALAPLDLFETVNLKCDPERAIELREQYPPTPTRRDAEAGRGQGAGITPGYHMNKQHWNTVSTTGDVPEKLLRELVDHSYELVKASLPKKVREGIDRNVGMRGMRG